MVCPKCNAELVEGHLYCDKCGEEIRIVPDFDPEIDEKINVTLSAVAEELSDVPTKAPETKLKKEKRKHIRLGRRKKFALFTGFFLLCVIVAAGVNLSRYYSYGYQYEKAQKENMTGNYELSIRTVRHAISLNATAMEAGLLLADNYYSLEKYDEAITVLLNLLETFPKEAALYDGLVKNYDAKGDTAAIHELIKNCGDEAVIARFSAYLSEPPLFSLEEGLYHEPEEVELTGSGIGTIYYTLNGSEPDAQALKYQNAISISEGTTIITAVYYNEKGIASDSVQKTYTVELEIPDAPVLLTKSGKYDAPELIKIEEPQEGIVYYTTDGSEPNADSEIYTLPIPMPLGTSTFKFIVMSKDSVVSEPIEAKYNLQIATIVDKATAEAAIQFFLQSKGDTKEGYEYLCTAAYGAGSRNYYLIDEYEKQEAEKVKTNRTFAVDVRTGELYKANQNIVKQDYEFSVLY